MSFGGSVSAMLSTLKNNKRSRVSTFEKLKGYEDVKYKKGRIEKKATPQQLKEIRDRLQKRNKRNTTIIVISCASVIIILFILFNFVRF
tara:strand:- start:536884 stop:537150 length:267 start_codon:yes stop_codon:yes gene_type:complete